MVEKLAQMLRAVEVEQKTSKSWYYNRVGMLGPEREPQGPGGEAVVCDGIEPAARSKPMARIVFTANIQRHVACPEAEAVGRTVREVLENVFDENPQARGYVLDDQAALRKHMAIFVDGQIIRDRARLTDAVRETSRIYVIQALSGG
jgi:sulfur carrier protein ThiS